MHAMHALVAGRAAGKSHMHDGLNETRSDVASITVTQPAQHDLIITLVSNMDNTARPGDWMAYAHGDGARRNFYITN